MARKITLLGGKTITKGQDIYYLVFYGRPLSEKEVQNSVPNLYCGGLATDTMFVSECAYKSITPDLIGKEVACKYGVSDYGKSYIEGFYIE